MTILNIYVQYNDMVGRANNIKVASKMTCTKLAPEISVLQHVYGCALAQQIASRATRFRVCAISRKSARVKKHLNWISIATETQHGTLLQFKWLTLHGTLVTAVYYGRRSRDTWQIGDLRIFALERIAT